MGNADALEQLEVAKAEVVRLERENARLAAALRGRDAEKWNEGFEAGATFDPSTSWGMSNDPPLNPYRQEADRG